MKHSKNVVLNLNASYKIKHEKYEEFAGSYFVDVYNQASRITCEIIESRKNDLLPGEGGGFMEPISNLIAFDGKRGSGKTSAMLSFCDFLKCYEYYRGGQNAPACKELIEMKQRVSFTVLDCIDATLITKPNDLLGAILGKMLVVIKDKEKMISECGDDPCKSMEIRKLKGQLGAIYSSLELNDMKNDAPGEILERLSCSWNQQDAFRDAVEKFNQYMAVHKDRGTQNYLVVPIDDVDMNLEQGYQLLEVIRKYLMVSNVIVFLAADYYQLGKVCGNAYRKMMDRVKMSVGELAVEYLEKLIPTGRRIYMPDLYPEEMLYNTKIFIYEENEEKMSIKRFILLKIWKSVGILLDINAEVNHWILPQSLRTLSNYINAMKDLMQYGNGVDRDEVFYNNVRWFYNDLMGRYLNEKELKNEDNKEIMGIIRTFHRDIPENKILNLIENVPNKKFNTMQSDKRMSYGYGTLLEELYDRRVEEPVQVIIQAVSFAVSLYLRTYVFAFESRDLSPQDREALKEEVLKVTKGDFWGFLEYKVVHKVGKSDAGELAGEFYLTWFNESADLSAEAWVLWAMQLGLLKGKEDGKVWGVLRFGNFIEIIFDYKRKIQEICKLLISLGIDKGKISRVEARFIKAYEEWENTYQTSCVIPFGNVEFMFNIFDQLYGTDGAFAQMADSSEITYGDMYMDAIERIAVLLKSYDEYYFDEGKNAEEKLGCGSGLDIPSEPRKGYYEIYVNCPFIAYMRDAAKEAGRKTIFAKIEGFRNVFLQQYIWDIGE